MKYITIILLLTSISLNAQRAIYAIEDDGIITLTLQDSFINRSAVIKEQLEEIRIDTIVSYNETVGIDTIISDNDSIHYNETVGIDTITTIDTIITQEAFTVIEMIEQKAAKWLAQSESRESKLEQQLERYRITRRRNNQIRNFLTSIKIRKVGKQNSECDDDPDCVAAREMSEVDLRTKTKTQLARIIAQMNAIK